MRRGRNYKPITITVDEETLNLLKEVRAKHMLSASMAFRAAIKEFQEAHHFE